MRHFMHFKQPFFENDTGLNISSGSAEPEGNVEPQIDTATTENVQETSVNSEAATIKPVQTPEQNAAFAAARRESERQLKQIQAENESFAKDCGFNSFAEMKEYQKQQLIEQKAQQLNVDPAFYGEFESVKNELNQFKTEKQQLEQQRIEIQQDTALKNDPVIKDFYTQWESEIKANAKAYGCDLDTAFTLKLRESLADITKGVATKAEQEAIKKITSNGASSPGSLAEGGDGSKTFFTKDEVRAMSQSEVSKNYDKICESMKKW